MNKRNLPAIVAAAAAICILAFLIGSSAGETEYTADGWRNDGSRRYYELPNGSVATGWQTIEGLQYYFDTDGTLCTGWLSLEGRRCYLYEDGTAAIGLCEIDGVRYLFDEEGYLADGMITLDGHRYMADENGQPLSGWAQQGTMRCYFDEDGRAVTGWQKIGSFDYYFYSDGSPAAGITQIGDSTYYFSSGGQYLPLVNPWHEVPEDYTVQLTQIDSNHSIASIAYDDFQEMMAACRAAGLDPAVCSSYRTQEYQELLYSRKVEYYEDKGYDQEEAEALAGRSVAVPGTSEHQLGLALDIIDNGNWNLNESQADTETQKWLMENSWRYGWILRYPDGKSEITGIIYEPWHYRYVGREVAAEIHELDLCLEEYLEMLTVG